MTQAWDSSWGQCGGGGVLRYISIVAIAPLQPTVCHYFLRLLKEKGLLLRCYTQVGGAGPPRRSGVGPPPGGEGRGGTAQGGAGWGPRGDGAGPRRGQAAGSVLAPQCLRARATASSSWALHGVASPLAASVSPSINQRPAQRRPLGSVGTWQRPPPWAISYPGEGPHV